MDSNENGGLETHPTSAPLRSRLCVGHIRSSTCALDTEAVE